MKVVILLDGKTSSLADVANLILADKANRVIVNIDLKADEASTILTLMQWARTDTAGLRAELRTAAEKVLDILKANGAGKDVTLSRTSMETTSLRRIIKAALTDETGVLAKKDKDFLQDLDDELEPPEASPNKSTENSVHQVGATERQRDSTSGLHGHPEPVGGTVPAKDGAGQQLTDEHGQPLQVSGAPREPVQKTTEQTVNEDAAKKQEFADREKAAKEADEKKKAGAAGSAAGAGAKA